MRRLGEPCGAQWPQASLDRPTFTTLRLTVLTCSNTSLNSKREEEGREGKDVSLFSALVVIELVLSLRLVFMV